MTNQLFRDYLDGKIHVRQPSTLGVLLTPTGTYLGDGVWPGFSHSVTFTILDETPAFKRFFLNEWIKTEEPTNPDLGHFKWSAPRQPAPPGMDNLPPTRMHLNMWASDQAPPADPRQQALAAKAARGKGPQSPAGWRGKERNIKYRSQ